MTTVYNCLQISSFKTDFTTFYMGGRIVTFQYWIPSSSPSGVHEEEYHCCYWLRVRMQMRNAVLAKPTLWYFGSPSKSKHFFWFWFWDSQLDLSDRQSLAEQGVYTPPTCGGHRHSTLFFSVTLTFRYAGSCCTISRAARVQHFEVTEPGLN